jgi:hypothetical protein
MTSPEVERSDLRPPPLFRTAPSSSEPFKNSQPRRQKKRGFLILSRQGYFKPDHGTRTPVIVDIVVGPFNRRECDDPCTRIFPWLTWAGPVTFYREHIVQKPAKRAVFIDAIIVQGLETLTQNCLESVVVGDEVEELFVSYLVRNTPLQTGATRQERGNRIAIARESSFSLGER